MILKVFSNPADSIIASALAAAACCWWGAQGCCAAFHGSRRHPSALLAVPTPALLRLPRTACTLRRQLVWGLVQSEESTRPWLGGTQCPHCWGGDRMERSCSPATAQLPEQFLGAFCPCLSIGALHSEGVQWVQAGSDHTQGGGGENQEARRGRQSSADVRQWHGAEGWGFPCWI